MKIEQVLIHYLLKFKQLPLQGIGTFIVEGPLPDTADPNRPVIIPEGSVSFMRDPSVKEDRTLVEFISEHTGKIKPLASSDLESYLILGRQFLNIGNPFVIPGIGTLEKNNSGDLLFKAGVHEAERMGPNKARIEDEGVDEHDKDMFNDYRREPRTNSGKTVLIAISLLILALAAWAVWRFAFSGDTEPETITNNTGALPVDTTVVDSTASDLQIDSAATVPAASGFKVVVNEYNTIQGAENRSNNLKKYGRNNVIVFTNDSSTFKVAEQYNRPLTDTTVVLDSLRRYYGKDKGKIEY